jgi:hypothetical protein
MKAVRSTLLLFCFAGFLVGFSQPAEPETPITATWIWKTGLIETEKAEILTFAKANGVNLLYLQINPDLPVEPYRSFLQEARAAGIEVHALAGDPSWAFADNRNRLLALIDWVKTYNNSAAATERFAGIHLDIEPYRLPQWKENSTSVIQQWMDNVAMFVAETKKEASLQASCDIPFWLDEIALPGQPALSLGEWMISQHDHVTLMAYRDQAEGTNGIIPLVYHELEAADRLGKKIMIGVEIKQSFEGEHVSFHEEGKTEMMHQLESVQGKLQSHASYRGISVHSYEYWKEAKE